MKKTFLLIINYVLLLPIVNQLYSQELNTYDDFQTFQKKSRHELEKIKYEDSNKNDYLAITQLIEKQSKTLEHLLNKNISFRSEVVSILLDNYTYCMRKYPDANDKEKLLGYFQKAIDIGLCCYTNIHFLLELKNSNVFDLIKNNECVKRNLKRYEIDNKCFEDSFIATPYKDQLSDVEKIAGLSKFWSEVKFNFAYFDQVSKLNWDSLYIAYIPKVREAKTTLEYYRTLNRMCTKLHDSHTNIYYAEELSKIMGRPPIRTRIIEDRIFITDVRNDSLIKSGLLLGSEIIKINGMPVTEYADKYIAPYVCASTRQDSIIRTFEYDLLKGKSNESLLLELRDKNGRNIKIEIARNLEYNISNWERLTFKTLENNIGYLAINSFSGNEIKSNFDVVYPQIKNSNALIIDVRYNGGGNSANGDYIISFFIDKSIKKWKWETREYKPAFRAWHYPPKWHQGDIFNLEPATKDTIYSKPIVLLTRASTFSAAEDFCLLFDIANRGIIMGEPTGGSTGQPLYFNLPGGGRARICTVRSYYPDGKEYVGCGIQPDILIHQTVEDFLNGEDTVLKEAYKYLMKQINN